MLTFVVQQLKKATVQDVAPWWITSLIIQFAGSIVESTEMEPRREGTHRRIDPEISLRQSRLVRSDVNGENPVSEQELSDSADDSTVHPDGSEGATFRMGWTAAALKKGSGVSVGSDEDSSHQDYFEPSESQFLVQRNAEERARSLLEQHRLERIVPQPVEIQEMGIAGTARHLVLPGTSSATQWRGDVGRSLSSPSSRSSGRILPSVSKWIGPTRLFRRAHQSERTKGESELHHLARVAAANLAGVQGIGDWGHDSDGTSGIDHDVLRDFH